MTATAEWPFRTLKRLESYLRSTKGQKQLKNLAVLHAHQDVLDELDIRPVINNFIFSNPVRSVNHLDIAPQHASVLMGLSNTFACVSSFLGTHLTGYIIGERNLEQWQYAFYVIIAVYLVGALLYWAFASGERQRWAPPAPTPESESLSLPQRSHVI
ncbi:hypothetical protein J6590_008649 [Homalodisca vitripennis]|nr:hypothetical protein J6590_008649 [Homalodisca vitripennis]